MKNKLEDRSVEGTITVSYKILCDSDINKELTLSDLLQNEKIAKLIKSEFAKGSRNLELQCRDEGTLFMNSQREIHTFEVQKDDFADLLMFAEEDAKSKKLLKKDCQRVELVDINTNTI